MTKNIHIKYTKNKMSPVFLIESEVESEMQPKANNNIAIIPNDFQNEFNRVMEIFFEYQERIKNYILIDKEL